jgi:hypothetical protein
MLLRTFVSVKLKYPLSNFSNGEKMKNVEVEKTQNPEGVGSRAGEGAFSPTPHDLARIVNEIKKELERIKTLDRALETLEFANRIEAAAVSAMGENFDAEYNFDEYPRTTLYVMHKDRYCVAWDLEWSEIEAIDIVKILNKEREVFAEVLVHYIADELWVGAYRYLKLKDVKGVNVEVVRE